jgi:dihydrofolate reductase
MQITLYIAPSIDGYIATSSRDSEWVSPACGESFMQAIHDYGCIILGSHTYDQYQGEMYPVKDVLNIVVSSDTSRHSTDPNLVFAPSPSSAITLAQSRGHDKALLIGGGTINAAFLKESLIDDIILDIHPLILGKGIKEFENIEKLVHLRRTSVTPMEDDLVQVSYQVIK